MYGVFLANKETSKNRTWELSADDDKLNWQIILLQFDLDYGWALEEHFNFAQFKEGVVKILDRKD